MTPNIDQHYCKHCDTEFAVHLGRQFSGDVFLVCPSCGARHYRHFANGEAIHCDITRRHDEPREVRAA